MQEILKNLYQYLIMHAQVSAFWLFGSVVQGTNRANSDIDIAVLFKEGLSAQQRFGLRLELMAATEELTGRKVDIIDMEAAPLFLQHQIRKTGRLIVEKDHTYRVNFDVRSRREYFDFAPVLDYRNQRLIQRVIGENQDG